MERESRKSIVDRIWELFASVRLAIIIFSVLGLTSIIGTILEQNAEPQRNIKLLAKFFGAGAAPTLYGIFDKLGFMDMYHSWWFILILLLFASNLIVCSIERLPRILKLVREPMKPLAGDKFKGFGIYREALLKTRPEKARAAVAKAVRKATGFNLSEVVEEHGSQLYSQKGNFTRLGVYIVHFSIIVILAGAIAGIFLGFKGHLNLPEGAVSNVAYIRGGQAEKPLGFLIRCDDFDVDFYPNSDMPKAYRSTLTVIKDGQEVLKKMIAVNEPLKYEGVTFYQSSYGMVPGGGEQSLFRLRLTGPGGKSQDVSLRFGGVFTVPGTNLTGTIEDFSPALGFDQATGRPFTYAEQMNNPGVLVSFTDGGKPKYRGWILKRYPETWRLPEGHTVQFLDLWGIQYTGLQVRRDPGVWIVYLGCLMMAVGLYIAFFMSHRRLWVSIAEEKNGSRVLVAASANKNRYAFERKIDRLIGLLAKEQEGGH